jgi:hypothetical protein
MAFPGSGDVRWIVNRMPTKNRLEEPYSIAKEISNLHWEAVCQSSNPLIKPSKSLDEVSLFDAAVRHSTDGQWHPITIPYSFPAVCLASPMQGATMREAVE